MAENERQEVELENQRSIMMLTNNDANFQPLVIFIPQWAKASLDMMPTTRQYQIYERFAHEVGDAWEKLLRES